VSEAQALTPRCPVCGSPPSEYRKRLRVAVCGVLDCPILTWDPKVPGPMDRAPRGVRHKETFTVADVKRWLEEKRHSG